MKAVIGFLYVLGAALFSALLGSIFGVVLALISPEFASECLFTGATKIVRYAAATGLLAGLLIGAGVMCFCMLVTAISTRWAKKKSKDD